MRSCTSKYSWTKIQRRWLAQDFHIWTTGKQHGIVESRNVETLILNSVNVRWPSKWNTSEEIRKLQFSHVSIFLKVVCLENKQTNKNPTYVPPNVLIPEETDRDFLKTFRTTVLKCPHISTTIFRLYVQSMWTMNAHCKVNHVELWLIRDSSSDVVWVASLLIQRSANCLKTGHGRDMKNCGYCPIRIQSQIKKGALSQMQSQLTVGDKCWIFV